MILVLLWDVCQVHLASLTTDRYRVASISHLKFLQQGFATSNKIKAPKKFVKKFSYLLERLERIKSLRGR
jgi:hypothetical protein